MPAPDRGPPSPDLQPSSKRPRQSSPDKGSPASLLSVAATSPTGDHIHDDLVSPGGGSGGSRGAAGKTGQSSSFRNVSACNRCRLRKNRCDQKLPSCASCEKAGVACVGYDPITKREIPRSYIFYLEKRVEQLEGLLTASSIAFPPAQNLDYCSKSGNGSPTDAGQSAYSDWTDAASSGGRRESNGDGGSRLQRIASKPGSSAGPGAVSNRYLGSTSGISFARVVFAAVQSSVSDQKSNSDKGGVRPYRPTPPSGNGIAAGAGAGTSMRDSFFGLHTKPTIHPATFPDRELGLRLISLYFEHANPQIPVLHKGEFMEMFERAYADERRGRGPRELYVLNMVFAIGAGIIVGNSKGDPPPTESVNASRQCQPEEYHASAIVHLEACLGSGGGLEDLQAVLLLANFALLRPVPPGLWYIIGVAVRLAVDLGLHYEDGKDLETGLAAPATPQTETVAKERGRREYVRDLRRRLWWCTYSFDRLVSICVGRPFGISDQVITTEFPSLLEDRYITPSGIVQPPREMLRPTYKLVAHHYFKLRLLQSEILQVLQFRQAQSARSGGNHQNPYMHTELPSPFLSKFDSFRSWRIDIDRRLWEWKNSAPNKVETGVAFSTDFLNLNYWQAIIMLYRQSLSVPAVFEGEYDTAKEVNSPTVYSAELREDEDRVYLKIAEAGQKILRLYRQLHLVGLVNYTYLTTHHLFVAGISYLYAIWHSPIVRSRLSMDEVDFTILAATSVFTDFMDKCPPAEACRDAFERTVKATLKMVNASGGFGQQYQPGHASGASSSRNSLDPNRLDWATRSDSASLSGKPRPTRHHRHTPSMDQPPTATADVYSNNPALLSAFQKGAQYRLPVGATVKTEPDGFSHMRNLPIPPRSNPSSTDTNNNNNNNPNTPEATTTLTIDQQIMPSPAALQQQQQQQQLSSPITEMISQPARTPTPTTGGFLPPQQQQQQFSQAPMSFSDLQGMEFLQNLNSSSSSSAAAACGGRGGGGGSGSATTTTGPGSVEGGGSVVGMDGVDFSGLADTQMDLGFGLGWEGLHHDFSDGQQLDLFDGFFFGGAQQQGGGGGGGGGAV
ncbi:fungal-specific transcription factor domain-containing protein [Chaetomidium leptoderma]|uniref:Fungal-specific transcription factor domain-containing protein n=1 Tax=Chaetomidium leptoderma TaxID=669021 RepID=A0AAN6VI56_9PEZI|nr:fungal-specific transcription factor domain-containing protein [Chaetomidium leptoderma]